MDRVFYILGSIVMFLGVGAGAFGAHSLSNYFEQNPSLVSSYEIAVRYQMIHGLALFAVAWATTKWPATSTQIAGYLFIGGIIIFCGSLYLLSLTGIKWLGAITPIGGIAFLAGWLLLAYAAIRG